MLTASVVNEDNPVTEPLKIDVPLLVSFKVKLLLLPVIEPVKSMPLPFNTVLAPKVATPYVCAPVVVIVPSLMLTALVVIELNPLIAPPNVDVPLSAKVKALPPPVTVPFKLMPLPVNIAELPNTVAP